MNFLPLRGTIFFFFFFYFSLQGKPFERDERNAMRVYFLFSSRRNEKLCSVGDDIPGVDKVIDDGTGEESLINLFYRAAGRERVKFRSRNYFNKLEKYF